MPRGNWDTMLPSEAQLLAAKSPMQLGQLVGINLFKTTWGFWDSVHYERNRDIYTFYAFLERESQMASLRKLVKCQFLWL